MLSAGDSTSVEAGGLLVEAAAPGSSTKLRKRELRRNLISAIYLSFTLGHAHISMRASSLSLQVLSATLAFDALVLAFGGFLLKWRKLLEFLGRVRFFADALAWPFFLSFAVKVGKNCDFIAAHKADNWEFMLQSLFYLLSLIFVFREVTYYCYVFFDPKGTETKILANLRADGNIDANTGRYAPARGAGSIKDASVGATPRDAPLVNNPVDDPAGNRNYPAGGPRSTPLQVPGAMEMTTQSTSRQASSSSGPTSAVAEDLHRDYPNAATSDAQVVQRVLAAPAAPALQPRVAAAGDKNNFKDDDEQPEHEQNLFSLAQSFHPGFLQTKAPRDELPGGRGGGSSSLTRGQQGVKADFGDCLPRNAVFGGYFRPLSEEADDGRLVFVPVPKRDGLYIASGIVMLEHLVLGFSAFVDHVPHKFPPLFFGAVIGFGGRMLEKKVENLSYARLSLRLSELLWMYCCFRQEQSCDSLF
ncbi:unnamed protein product [Amoebophrya sp. A120]|nr:unnamed protein product [Amoebophrya sp. A120]|eukprot:GSA120T00021048001.1